MGHSFNKPRKLKEVYKNGKKTSGKKPKKSLNKILLQNIITNKSKILLRALYSYEAMEENDLSFNNNDLLETEEDITEKNWVKAKCLTTQNIGMIPMNYVRVEDQSPSSYDFFYDINRVEAERLLQVMSNPSGTFLIRPSTNKPNIALSVRIEDPDEVWIVRHYVIYFVNEKWYLAEDKLFDTVIELIAYYNRDDVHFLTKLVQPLPRKESPPIQFQQMEVSRNNFSKLEILGRGNFGEVWKARWGKNSNHFVAIKIIKSDMMTNADFLSEAKIMHSLRHPRIVELLGVCTQPDTEPIYIITEYMSKGALLNFLRSTKGKLLNFKKLIDQITQVCEGMEYLEKRSYVHRDLRAANILIGTNNFVKVADFGLARIIQQDEEIYNATESKFPVRWTAPEAALRGKFSVKSDVWSFGILIFEIITYGSTPYANLATKDVLFRIISNNYRLENPNEVQGFDCSITCPPSLYNIMLRCWNHNPDERPTFTSLVNIFCNWEVSTEGFYDDQ